MRKFRNLRVVPPGGVYFYEVPETRAYLKHPSRRGLATAVSDHYRTNRLPAPPNLDALIQDFMCRRLPDGFCTGGGPDVKIVTLRGVREATAKLLSRAGFPATPGEARQRAAVCGSCKLNDRTLCPTCVGLVSWGLKQVRQPALGFEGWLGVCGVDISAVSAKVYVKSGEASSGHPANCWMKNSEEGATDA